MRREDANPNAPAFSTWQLAVGVGYRAESWSAALAWQHTFERELRVSESTISSDLDDSTQSFAADSVLLSFSLYF